VSDMYENASRMLATSRPSRHVQMVWRVANISATSRAWRVGFVDILVTWHNVNGYAIATVHVEDTDVL